MTNAAGPAFEPCPLVEDFGRKSSVAREGVQAIYTTLCTSNTKAAGEPLPVGKPSKRPHMANRRPG